MRSKPPGSSGTRRATDRRIDAPCPKRRSPNETQEGREGRQPSRPKRAVGLHGASGGSGRPVPSRRVEGRGQRPDRHGTAVVSPGRMGSGGTLSRRGPRRRRLVGVAAGQHPPPSHPAPNATPPGELTYGDTLALIKFAQLPDRPCGRPWEPCSSRPREATPPPWRPWLLDPQPMTGRKSGIGSKGPVDPAPRQWALTIGAPCGSWPTQSSNRNTSLGAESRSGCGPLRWWSRGCRPAGADDCDCRKPCGRSSLSDASSLSVLSWIRSGCHVPGQDLLGQWAVIGRCPLGADQGDAAGEAFMAERL
jgi:hypothetical protein